jgi:hypothetical protein
VICRFNRPNFLNFTTISLNDNQNWLGYFTEVRQAQLLCITRNTIYMVEPDVSFHSWILQCSVALLILVTMTNNIDDGYERMGNYTRKFVRPPIPQPPVHKVTAKDGLMPGDP